MSAVRRKRILLVDDDRDFVEATSVVLESVGDVEIAYGGNEGLAKARAGKPDLIILDVIMPDEDGFAVCQKLKADPDLASIPVMMLTSLPDELGTEGVPRGIRRAEDYVEKPVKPSELLKRVNRFLAERSKSD